MARQESLLPFSGTIGNIIFYKTIDGYLARKKGGISADRIHSDPNFARTRENNAEFGNAARASRLIRSAFHSLLYNASDARVTGRLNGALVKVIREDAVNMRGLRNVVNGDLSLLKNFNFNKHTKLAATLLAPYTTSIDHSAGTLTVDIPPFIPTDMIRAPKSATHFVLNAGGAAFDFPNMTFELNTAKTGMLPLTDARSEPLKLVTTVTPDSPHPLLLVLGIEFIQSVNDVAHPLQDTAFNALAIVRTDTGMRS